MFDFIWVRVIRFVGEGKAKEKGVEGKKEKGIIGYVGWDVRRRKGT